MTEVIFTMPGKVGDALHQWPIAYHWAGQHQRRFSLWLDQHTLKPLVPLFKAQPCVDEVVLKPGIENWSCGGQPFHFDLDTKEFLNRTVYHLGLRGFPTQQLTLQCLEHSRVPVDVSRDALVDEPSLATSVTKVNRVLLHGQAVYAHTRSTPTFWRFLYDIRKDLERCFDEVVFIGNARDREVAARTYPEWGQFDDCGDFKVLADYMAASRLVIGVGSSNVALASLLKVPSVRVHDPIGELPKAIWDNLQRDHLNETEPDLRRLWPEWFAERFEAKVSV